MSAPVPYYETPAGAPSRVRLYLGDCRKLLPLVAPPEPRVLVLADRPYGVALRTVARGPLERTPIHHGKRFATRIRRREMKPIHGDDQLADASDLASYHRRLDWGWNHFSASLPPSPSMIVWDKRAGSEPDDGADVEIAWTNLGGPARIFRHLWRGTCRASETGVQHLHPTQKPEAFYRWLFAGRGRGKPVVSWPSIEREYLDTIIRHRIEPALKATRQIDIWAPRPAREEQLSLAPRGT